MGPLSLGGRAFLCVCGVEEGRGGGLGQRGGHQHHQHQHPHPVPHPQPHQGSSKRSSKRSTDQLSPDPPVAQCPVEVPHQCPDVAVAVGLGVWRLEVVQVGLEVGVPQGRVALGGGGVGGDWGLMVAMEGCVDGLV